MAYTVIPSHFNASLCHGELSQRTARDRVWAVLCSRARREAVYRDYLGRYLSRAATPTPRADAVCDRASQLHIPCASGLDNEFVSKTRRLSDLVIRL